MLGVILAIQAEAWIREQSAKSLSFDLAAGKPLPHPILLLHSI
jgi:hypothetical protein